MKSMKRPLILAVDDNPQNLQVLAGILENNGYDTALAQNGEIALTFIEKELPDLILLDIMMPGMDGNAVCEHLKKQPKTSKIPVIMVTAKSEMDDLVKGFAVGAVDYVVKPFRREELLARVATHVELARSREELAELKGFLPVCANCKSIRNEEGEWESMENYISEHSTAHFSHGICPRCIDQLYPEIALIMRKQAP